MDADATRGVPLVAHVVVALCDNRYQGIVPVSASLGDGDSPHTNLYWGALYGVKTFFSRSGGWQMLKVQQPENPAILERVVFSRNLLRNGKEISVRLVADAWRGRNIQDALEYFFDMSAGRHMESIDTAGPVFSAGGAAHVFAYVGHNGLMDFSLPTLLDPSAQKQPSSAIVLACKSDTYFRDRLSYNHVLLTTSGFMAPEAYSLEAALTHWFSGKSPAETHLAAASAYSRYQKARLDWTKKLFVVGE